jgi:hypothetical protein
LKVENTDDRPVSVRQYVQAVHEYAMPLRRLLYRCCDIWGAEDEVGAEFWYECTMGGSRSKAEDVCPVFVVFLMEDTNEGEVEGNIKGLDLRYRRDLASR